MTHEKTAQEMIKPKGNTIIERLLKTCFVFTITAVLLFNNVNVSAQVTGISSSETKSTANKSDQNLKSIAKVNPSTLAMEFSLPLTSYPGRNGNSLPIGFSYSSKIWRMDSGMQWWYWLNTQPKYVTDINARFAERSAAGWTSNLLSPRIDESVQIFNEQGQPYSENILDVPGLNNGWQNILNIFAQNTLESCGANCGGWSQVCYNGDCGSWMCSGGWTYNFCNNNQPPSFPSPPPPIQLYYVKRVQVAMADGSTHEFRVSDTPINCGNNQSGCIINLDGIFLSVDGSGMKLVRDSSGSTLYLPNGSKYLFPATEQNGGEGIYAETYFDVDGNKMGFSSTPNPTTHQNQNKWTDTLGREIVDPMPQNWIAQTQSSGTKTINLPSLAGGNQQFKMKWLPLKPRGCETDDTGSSNPDCADASKSPLEIINQKLYFETKYFCKGNISINLVDLHNSEVLFPEQESGTRPCNSFDVNRDENGDVILDDDRNPIPIPVRFNPVVLADVELPNGKKYEFKYNRYGEITKIIYPTGSYETFEYGWIKPMNGSGGPAYDQTNRGVKERKVYSKNGTTDTLEQRWRYSADYEYAGINSTYKITTKGPKGNDAFGDGIMTERFLHLDIIANGDFGFNNPLAGLPKEERVYAENDWVNPRSRTLTEWIIKENGNAKRDARVKRSVSIIIENGQALANLSETEYNEPNVTGNNAQTDAEYFSHLNVKRAKSYHYAVIDLNTAQTGTLPQIANYFNQNLLANIAETDYQYDPNYKARGISSLPIESRVLDKDSNVIAKTQTVYDNAVPASNSNYLYAIQTYSGLETALNCPTGSQTTTVCWQNPNAPSDISLAYRGKPTTSRLWDNDNNNWIETHTRYDQFGNVVKVKDAAGNEATTEFNAQYLYAYPTKVITPAPDPDNTGHGTNEGSFATTVYDFMTGLSLTATNEFNQTVQTEYTDALLRPTRVSGVAPFVIPISETIYNDDNNNLYVKVRKQIDETNWDEAISYMDSLGRTYKTQAKDSQGDVFVETEYDLLGRVKRATNPYRLSDLASGGAGKIFSQPRYDALGRVFETCTALTGAALNPNDACPTGASTGITQFDISTEAGYVGTTVTATDASGRKSRSLTNALGQLTRVDEPSSTNTLEVIPQSTPSPNPSPTPTPGGGGHQCAANCPTNLTGNDYGSLSTYYVYNVQGKMVKVMQGGQIRYFKYDSLGRLIRVRQPEQEANDSLDLADTFNTSGKWSAKFTYDFLGNVLTTTDAKGTVITNTYDKAGRVKTRTYSGETGVTTPAVSYFYDGKGLDSQQSPNYAKGKLTKVTSSISETRYALFDSFGRLTRSEQRTPVNDETIGTTTPRVSLYEYNFAGALIKETYPSGRVVQNEFEADGDLLRVFGKANSGATEKTYANSFSYTASGGISQLKLGNGRWETAKFNERLQLTELGLGYSSADASLWKVNYDYGELENGTVNTNKNTGNIARQTLSFAGLQTPIVQTYKFDSLERLIEAKETSGTASNAPQNWIQNFGYDRFGNRISFNQQIGQTTLNQTPAINPNTNRFSGNQFSYDKNGNITTDIDPTTSLSRTFVFNGENKQTEVKNSSGATIGKYFYDGEGNRVKKETNTEITVFVYSAGKLVAEYSTQITPQQERTTSYTTTDHLGSPRVITDALGQVKTRRDFMPFGEDLTINVGARSTALKYGTSDNIRQKFTGYEKDTETSLDFAEARMYENRHGRFTAVDPLLASGKSANPQTFNRFVYVGNNPIVRIDPTGEDWIISKKPDKNGIYTYKDAYGKKLDKLLASGQYDRVDFNGKSSTDFTSYRLGEAAGIYRIYAEGGGEYIKNFAEERKREEQAKRVAQEDKCNAGCQALIQSLGGRAPAMMTIINTGAIISTSIIAAPYVASALAGGGGSSLISLGLSNPTTTTTATTFGTVVATNSDKTSQVAQSFGATVNNFGTYLAGKAPFQVTPGTKLLEGQYVNNLGRIEPWRAYYDQFGRQIARTDFNAGNRTAGIPPIHHILYGYNNGVRFTIQNHIPGAFRP